MAAWMLRYGGHEHVLTPGSASVAPLGELGELVCRLAGVAGWRFCSTSGVPVKPVGNLCAWIEVTGNALV